MNYRLWFDNFFTTFSLLDQLRCVFGIMGCGTVNPNRAEFRALNLKKPLEIGASEWIMRGENLSVCVWQDTKRVACASNHLDPRWDGKLQKFKRQRGSREKVGVDQPAIFRSYSSQMGHVDASDSLCTSYKISQRSRRWWMPVLMSLVEHCIINAWKLHCAWNAPELQLSHKQFRCALVREMLAFTDGKVAEEPTKNPRARVAARCKSCDVPKNRPRKVQQRHWTIEMASTKYCGCDCGQRTKFGCGKCGVHCLPVHMETYHEF